MFETTLSARREQGRRRRAMITLPVAIIVHAAAIGVVLAAQLWVVGDVPEPVLMVAMWQAPIPPPAPPPRGDRGTTTPSHAVTPAVPDTQITAIPDTPADSTARLDPVGDPNGVPGGVPGGTDNGIPGGAPTERKDPTLAVVEEDGPIVIGGEVVKPVLTQRTEPLYPEVARRVGVQGVAIVEAIIDRTGGVVDARVLRDPGMGCGEAVVQAVRQWRYQPATLNGRAISVYLTITVNFKLR